MTPKTVGRITLLKYGVTSVVAILTLLTFVVPEFWDTHDEQSASDFLDHFGEHMDFIYIQVAVLAAGIWILGGLSGHWIIEKGKSEFIVGSLALLLLWLLFYLSSTVTASIMNSNQEGSLPASWTLIPPRWAAFAYPVGGIIHGVTMGYFLGREIVRKGSR